jgi:hypothetical protein
VVRRDQQPSGGAHRTAGALTEGCGTSQPR